MSIPFHSQQIQFMFDIASHRNSFFDPLFRFLAHLDSPYFAFLLIPIVWVGFSHRWGIRLFYLLAISTLLNTLSKELLGWPRPCSEFPGLGMLCPQSFGFPSGGAQTCMLLGSLLIYTWRTRAAWVLGISYIVIGSFTRIYLGVHYPIDILGGWAIGSLLLFLYVKLAPPFEAFLKSKTLLFSFLLSEAFPLALMCLTTSSVYHRIDLMAVGLGICLSLKYALYLPRPQSVGEGILRGGVASATIFLLFSLLRGHVSIPINFALLGLWLSLGVSPFCKMLLRIRCR